MVFEKIIHPQFLKEFLGILSVDTLHDTKGKISLFGVKLSQITDLFAETLLLHNPEKGLNREWVQIFFFKTMLQYFCESWCENVYALNLQVYPDFTRQDFHYWNDLRDRVSVPMRSGGGDRFCETSFAGLGGHKPHIEAYNYAQQKAKLDPQRTDCLAFISPHQMESAIDYFIQANGIVDILAERTNGGKVALDMKSAAGLIRTITDPLGYITNLATLADPGYNMIGMSAIRKNSKKVIDGHDFEYCIRLQTPLSPEPLDFLRVSYCYNQTTEIVSVNILDKQFNGGLPRSMHMSEALAQYLAPTPKDVSITLADIVEKIYAHLKDLYERSPSKTDRWSQVLSQRPLQESDRQELLKDLQNSSIDRFDCKRIVNWLLQVEWDQQIPRWFYILASQKNMQAYDYTFDSIIPTVLIESELPHLMSRYKRGEVAIDKVGCAYHQLLIIKMYALYPNNLERFLLLNLLDRQWLPSRREGKLTTQIVAALEEHLDTAAFEPFQPFIYRYFDEFITVCQKNLGAFVQIEDHTDMFDFMCKLPLFSPPDGLKELLLKRVALIDPHLDRQNTHPNGLLLAELLRVIEPLTQLDFNQHWVHKVSATPRENQMNAIYNILGKFSGDFGQILCSLANGYIFATEDSNASAMALLMHRTKESDQVWATIHGLGDGGSVDITISK